jgi:hypothetical protein
LFLTRAVAPWMRLLTICAVKSAGFSLDAKSLNPAPQGLQVCDLAASALCLPVPPYLFGIHDGRDR